jgi:hypothetical protein
MVWPFLVVLDLYEFTARCRVLPLGERPADDCGGRPPGVPGPLVPGSAGLLPVAGGLVAMERVLLALMASFHAAPPEPVRQYVPPPCQLVPGPAGAWGKARCVRPNATACHSGSRSDA